MSRHRTSTILYVLVKSLSPEEFKVLKVYGNAFQKNTLTWQLIEFLYGMERFDREAVNARFEGSDVYSLFYYAYEYLLKAIWRNGFTRLPELKALPDMMEVAIERGADMQFMPMMDDAVMKLRTAELFSQAREVCMMRKAMRIRLAEAPIPMAELRKMDAEIDELLEKEQNLMGYIRLRQNYQDQVKLQFAVSGEMDRPQLSLMMRHPLFSDDSKPLSVRARLHYLLAREMYRYLVQDYETARALALEARNLFESNPIILKDMDTEYWAMIQRLCNYHSLSADLGSLLKEMRVFDQVDFRKPMLRRTILPRYIQCHVLVLSLATDPEIQQASFRELDQYDLTESVDETPVAGLKRAFLMAAVCMRLEDYPRFDFWYTQFEQKEKKVAENVYSVWMRVLRLIVLLQQRSEDFESTHYNITRFFKRTGRREPQLDRLMSLVKKMGRELESGKVKSSRETVQELIGLHAEMSVLREDMGYIMTGLARLMNLDQNPSMAMISLIPPIETRK